MELPGDGLTVIIYTAPADSEAQHQLGFLASWSSTAETAADTALSVHQSDDRA
jgi:hypothetical protein